MRGRKFLFPGSEEERRLSKLHSQLNQVLDAAASGSLSVEAATASMVRTVRGVLGAVVLFGGYLLHVFCLSEKEIAVAGLPPAVLEYLKRKDIKFHWSDVAGLLVFLAYSAWQYTKPKAAPAPASSLTANEASPAPESPAGEEGAAKKEKAGAALPWRIPKKHVGNIAGTYMLLVVAFLATSIYASQIDVSIFGTWKWPPPEKDLRASLFVLIPHLLWVSLAVSILNFRFPPFFQPQGTWLKSFWYPGSSRVLPLPNVPLGSADAGREVPEEEKERRSWWWAWAIGGYYVSSLLYKLTCIATGNVASTIETSDSGGKIPTDLRGIIAERVFRVIHKESTGMTGFFAAFGPCVSGPLIEEVLYRAFLLPALTVRPGMPVWASMLLSSIIFALSHIGIPQKIAQLAQLTMLGLAWAVIYVQCGNLAAPSWIHLAWNNATNRYFLTRLVPAPARAAIGAACAVKAKAAAKFITTLLPHFLPRP